MPKDSYGPLPMGTPKGLSHSPLRPETSPHLLLGAWCEDAGLLGGRSDSKAVLSRVVNPAHPGIDFRVENLSKSHLGQPPTPCTHRKPPCALLPRALVISPKSRFSKSLKGDKLYRISNLTMAHHRTRRLLSWDVNAIMPARRRGCCLAWC